MKLTMIICAALIMFAMPAGAVAAPAQSGPYVGVFIGGSAQQSQDVTTTFNSGSSIDDRVRFDPGISVGGNGGYDFGYVRLEGELSYKHSEIDSVTERDSGVRYGSMRGSLGAYSFMANGFIDLHNPSPVTPYFGGGIGFATLHLSDTSGKVGGQRYSLYDADDEAVFAYQVGAGLEIALNRRLSLDLGYRYFATARATFNEGAQETSMKFESHNGTVGVRFKF